MISGNSPDLWLLPPPLPLCSHLGETATELIFLRRPWNNCFLVEHSVAERGLHAESTNAGFLLPLMPLTPVWRSTDTAPFWAAVLLGERRRSLRPFRAPSLS